MFKKLPNIMPKSDSYGSKGYPISLIHNLYGIDTCFQTKIRHIIWLIPTIALKTYTSNRTKNRSHLRHNGVWKWESRPSEAHNCKSVKYLNIISNKKFTMQCCVYRIGKYILIYSILIFYFKEFKKRFVYLFYFFLFILLF